MVFKKVLIGQPLRADNWPCHTDKLSFKVQFKNSPKLKAYNKDDPEAEGPTGELPEPSSEAC